MLCVYRRENAYLINLVLINLGDYIMTYGIKTGKYNDDYSQSINNSAWYYDEKYSGKGGNKKYSKKKNKDWDDDYYDKKGKDKDWDDKYDKKGKDKDWDDDDCDQCDDDYNVITGDDCDNVLCGTECNDKIDGKDGNDTIYGKGGDDLLYGGDGCDYIDGGEGCDTICGGDGDDILIGGGGNDTLYGGDGNDKLYGSNEADCLYGEDGCDLLDGGYGNDYLNGGSGADTYVFGACYGEDVIEDCGDPCETDVVEFKSDINLSDVCFTVCGCDLLVTAGKGDSITIKDWFAGSQNQIEEFKFCEGTITNTQINDALVCYDTVCAPSLVQNDSRPEDANIGIVG